MKKITALLLCLVMLLSLAACGGNNPAAAKPAPTAEGTASDQPETDAASLYEVTEPVTMEFWCSVAEEDRIELLKGWVDEYNASQDLVTVAFVSIPAYGTMDEQLSAAQAAGKGLPGLAFINVPRIQTYAASGMNEPLNAYIEATGFDIEDFNPGMIDGMTYDADGQIYGMPFGISSGVMYWNMDLLKAAGADGIPETWSELIELAPAIKAAAGATAFGSLSELNYNEVLLRNAGVDPLGDGVTATMMNEDLLSFLQEYKGLIDAGEAEYFMGSDANGNIMASFYSGQLAAMLQSSTLVNVIPSNCDFEVGTSFGLINDLDPAQSYIAGAAALIPAMNDQQTKNAAWDFLTWMLSKEHVFQWTKISNYYPCRVSVYTDEAMMAEIFEQVPLYENVLAGMDGVSSKNKTPYQTACYKVINNAMGSYFYEGADLEATWQAAEDEVNYILAGN